MGQIDNDGWMTLMREIHHIERQLPNDEIWAIDATQALGELILDYGAQLTPARRAHLVHIAAMVAREGNREIMAGVEAELALRRAALA